MSRIRAVCLVVGLVAGCARPAAVLTREHAAALRDSVAQVLTEHQRLSAAGQWDSVLGLFAADSSFRWVERGKVVARSREAIREELSRLPRGTRLVTSYEGTDITALAPGVAVVLTDFQTRLTDSAGAGFSFGGVLTVTMVHQPTGWKFLNGHASGPTEGGPTR